MIQKGLVLLALVALASFGAAAAPTIQVDNPTYTTKADSNSVVTHTFQLTNAGDSLLTIGSVTASCGCTTTTLAKTELAPGESVGLEAKVNTTGFSGTVQKTVTVHTNDPATPSLVLRMTLELPAAAPAPAASTPASPTPVTATSTSTSTAPAKTPTATVPTASGPTASGPTASGPTASAPASSSAASGVRPATPTAEAPSAFDYWPILSGVLGLAVGLAGGIAAGFALWGRKRRPPQPS